MIQYISQVSATQTLFQIMLKYSLSQAEHIYKTLFHIFWGNLFISLTNICFNLNSSFLVQYATKRWTGHAVFVHVLVCV